MIAAKRVVRSGLAMLSCVAIVGAASLARAQAKPADAATPPEDAGKGKPAVAVPPAPAPAGPQAATAAPAPLAAVVRGLFVGTRFTGGYMVLRQKINDPQNWPVLTNQKADEGYGIGTMLQLEVGYDIAPVVAVEALGGVSLVNGTRKDRVRDLGIMFGGLALRLSPAIDPDNRLRAVFALGGGYASADDAVEKPQNGPAVFFNAGIEYYVHVRHFSIGLDISVLAPVSPLRLLVGAGPQVKYTF